MNDTSKLSERLGNVQVGLRQDLNVSRHIVRGASNYIIHDPTRFTSHQLDARDYQVFVSLSAERTLSETFRQLVDDGDIDAEQESEFYRFIVFLNQNSLLDLPTSSGANLYDRFLQRQKLSKRWSLSSLLFVRVPLFEPDRFLSRTVGLTSFLFSRSVLALWLVTAITCGFILVRQWHEFVDPLSSIISNANLPLLWALLVGLKVVHEFGHAYACKRFGGPVPEMGAFFMVGIPCAYMDASSSWTFRSRWQRIVVSLAGMYFESMVAMAALVFWFFAVNSPWRSMAHYTFLLSSVVTIGFNVNPLMRYDGYYVLADLVNLPNLRTESSQAFWGYLKWLFFGVSAGESGRSSRMRFWLIFFGFASALYRVVVVLGISILIVSKIPFTGSVLAGSVFVSLVFGGLKRLILYVMYSEELADRRPRAVSVTALGLVAVVLLIFVVRLPRSSRAYGVVERRNDVVLRAGASGFLEPVSLHDGDQVAAGEMVCRLRNEGLGVDVQTQRLLAESLSRDVVEAVRTDIVAAGIAEELRTKASDDLGQLETQHQELLVLSPISGQLAESRHLQETGRYIRQGETIGRISDGNWVLKVVATEDNFSNAQIALGQQVKVRVAGPGMRTLDGTVVSIAKSASAKIDDPRLAHVNGGPITVDPQTMVAQLPYFRITIELGQEPPERVMHGMSGVAFLPRVPQPLGTDLYRVVLRFLFRVDQQQNS